MAFGHFLLGSHNFMVTSLGSCVKWPSICTIQSHMVKMVACYQLIQGPTRIIITFISSQVQDLEHNIAKLHLSLTLSMRITQVKGKNETCYEYKINKMGAFLALWQGPNGAWNLFYS